MSKEKWVKKAEGWFWGDYSITPVVMRGSKYVVKLGDQVIGYNKTLRNATLKARLHALVAANAVTPDYYMSTSEGKWRLFHKGDQITPDMDSEEAARAAARFAGVPLSQEIWDGDKSTWIRKS